MNPLIIGGIYSCHILVAALWTIPGFLCLGYSGVTDIVRGASTNLEPPLPISNARFSLPSDLHTVERMC